KRQFHHLVRTVPRRGRLIVNAADSALAEVLAMGCWTPVERFAVEAEADWQAQLDAADGSAFRVLRRGQPIGTVDWSLQGRHNVANALAALAAAEAVGLDARAALPYLAAFRSVKRRMQVLKRGDVWVFDDFAHHPTAIRETLAGLRAQVGAARIVVALEPRS